MNLKKRFSLKTTKNIYFVLFCISFVMCVLISNEFLHIIKDELSILFFCCIWFFWFSFTFWYLYSDLAEKLRQKDNFVLKEWEFWIKK